MIKITEAEAGDISTLADFARDAYAAAFGGALGASRLKAHLGAEMTDAHFVQMFAADQFYLAHRLSELIGFGQVGRVDSTYGKYLSKFHSNGAELRRLYVRRDCQSRGVGSEIIHRVLLDPIAINSPITYLTTWGLNFGAQKLYSQHNFSKIGEMPEYDDQGQLTGYEYIMARLN